MDNKHIAQLEAHLERLVEGAFTSIFRKTVSAHDIALKLARSMESNLRYLPDSDNRPAAPDNYGIHLHPRVHEQLQRSRPTLPQILSEHLIELAAQSGYRLLNPPALRLIADEQVSPADVMVHAGHSDSDSDSTASMQPIRIQETQDAPHNAQLIINSERTVSLSQPVINIGRSDENDIMIDDPFISRHHVQIRLRFGGYMLFDVDSRSGTFVNNVRVSEHRLQTGDVIRIGDSQLIYLGDEPARNSPRTTQSFDPVE